MKIKKIIVSTILYLLATVVIAPKLSAQPLPDLSQFPLHINYKKSDKPLLVFITGDGGWNSFSRNLVTELVKNGYAVVSLDSRKYFWEQKSPDTFAKDMQLILSAYLKTWNKSTYSVIGYSFGADVAAFLPAHLSGNLSAKMNSLVLMSPGLSTGYVVKLKNLLNIGSTDKEQYKVYPELLKGRLPVWCIFGKEEDSDFYPLLKESALLHKMGIPGSHRYNDDVSIIYKAVSRGL